MMLQQSRHSVFSSLFGLVDEGREFADSDSLPEELRKSECYYGIFDVDSAD